MNSVKPVYGNVILDEANFESNDMKKSLPLLTCIIPALLIFPFLCSAQTNRNNSRLRSLQTAVEKSEARMADAEKKMAIGDSLIWYGDSRIAEADKDFFRIANEVKTLNRDYRDRRKELIKQNKSDFREIALTARTELQKLDMQYQADMRNYSAEAREMKKKAALGESDICKGQQMQAAAAKNIRISEKALRDARERYELALGTLGN
jgi:hypothetical protein